MMYTNPGLLMAVGACRRSAEEAGETAEPPCTLESTPTSSVSNRLAKGVAVRGREDVQTGLPARKLK